MNEYEHLTSEHWAFFKQINIIQKHSALYPTGRKSAVTTLRNHSEIKPFSNKSFVIWTSLQVIIMGDSCTQTGRRTKLKSEGLIHKH